jgi:hypothetical protein
MPLITLTFVAESASDPWMDASPVSRMSNGGGLNVKTMIADAKPQNGKRETKQILLNAV